jgi:hypothetical protein
MKQNKKTATIQTENAIESVLPASQMSQDLKTAVLIVSVLANLFVFTAWIALQVTTKFDVQIANFLFNR